MGSSIYGALDENKSILHILAKIVLLEVKNRHLCKRSNQILRYGISVGVSLVRSDFQGHIGPSKNFIESANSVQVTYSPVMMVVYATIC